MVSRIAIYLFALGACLAATAVTTVPPGDVVLWHEPRQMTDADWVWGPWGPDQSPSPPFQFVKENLSGTNPKVDVRDSRGILWSVKFGGEIHPEVFASRLLAAVGYAAGPTYFVVDGEILGVTGLRRAKGFINEKGEFHSARFQLRSRQMEYAREYQWSWIDNPFLGTHELNGLRILMMLLSNWDAKDSRDAEGSNTSVFRDRNADSGRYVYAMTDWGSSLGSWGGFFQRSRWDPGHTSDRQTSS